MDPYRPPQSDQVPPIAVHQRAVVTPEFAKCYNCGAQNATKCSFTWWGGLIGPAILNHVQCNECHTQYSGTSGQSNTTAIVIYLVVVGGIAAVVGVGFAMMG